MDNMERRGLELEEILKEFGDNTPAEETQEQEPAPELLEQTRRMDPVLFDEVLRTDSPWQQTRRMEPIGQEVSEPELDGDTIRLDTLRLEIAGLINPQEQEVSESEWNPEDTIRSEPYSEQWEPEYEQPMGAYVPPQPIQFQPRSRLHELKRKLVAGPEKRFYELSEIGAGKLQIAIFLSLLVVLISAASTGMYAMGMVQENRLRLMVFSQFMALLVSGLLGSFQLIDGFTDLTKKRFTLNTLLAVTFLVCCLDGALCLYQVRVPCCAAFSLEVTMSLWSTYQRRSMEISQMDTMRRAVRLDGIVPQPEYLDGQKGLLRAEGQVEDFMDTYAEIGKPERVLNLYAFGAMCAAFAIGLATCVLNTTAEGAGILASGVQVTAICLIAAVPASAFISQSRPACILQRRLHKLGTVLCGWQGVEGLSGKAVFPIEYFDLYPVEAMRLNGMKFFGSREPVQVITYATAVITDSDCGLKYLFAQLLDSHNGRHFQTSALTHYDNGGVGGVVNEESVLVGSFAFMKDMEIAVPDSARVSNGVYVAVEGQLCGLFAVNYEKNQSSLAGLTTLTAYRKLQCAFVSDDFMVTYGFLKGKFGIKPKRFLLPDYETRAQLRKAAPEENAPVLLMTTARGLAPVAYGVTGARVLRSACRLGTVLHMAGGIVGLGMMLLLVILGALELLTPVNMFLYQLIWMIPGLLITEWTRSI